MSSSHPEFMFGDRLSPLPEDRANSFHLDPRPNPTQLRNWDKEDVKNLGKLLLDPIVLHDYSLAAHHARVKDTGLPKKTDPSWRGRTRVNIPRDRSGLVCDSEGSICLVVQRGFLKGSCLTNVNISVDAHMPHEFKKRHPVTAPTPPSTTTPRHNTRSAAGIVSANATPCLTGAAALAALVAIDPSETEAAAKASKTVARHHRHWDDWYLKTTGQPWGDWHFVLAWHATGRKWSDAFTPSRELLAHSTTVELTRRLLFIDSFFAIHHRVNHFLSLAFFSFSKLLRSARSAMGDRPVIKTLLPIWHSDFPGQAILMNKQSGEHLDISGVRHGVDVIVVTGEFGGGQLYLKDLNVLLDLEPGDLVIFDGTVQRHRILSFDGPQRVSHVFFAHQSVFTELGIDTSGLQDPTLEGLRQRLKAFPAERRARAEAARLATLQAERSRRSHRGGKNNKKPASA